MFTEEQVAHLNERLAGKFVARCELHGGVLNIFTKPEENIYQTFEEAIALVKDAREFQAKAWPNTEKLNAGGRPFEEWIVLLNHYMTKLHEVYTVTPGNVPNLQGEYVPNIEGRQRVRKYAAIVANLAIWAVQSAVGSAYSD